jgi:chromosomal replication initiator protein
MPDPIRLDPELLRQRLHTELGEQKARMWFGESTGLELDGGALRVTAGSPYAAAWIDRHFAGTLRRLAREAAGGEIAVAVASREEPRGGVPAAAAGSMPVGRGVARGGDRGESRRTPRPGEGGDSGSSGRMDPPGRGPWMALPGDSAAEPAESDAAPRRPGRGGGSGAARPAWRRLEEFVVGDSNRLAYSVAERVAAAAGHESLLFVHGDCGVGKTHLLQGICRRRRESRPGEQVRYLTGEQFTNEFIAAVRSGSIEGFRRRCRRLDLLAIDDVHFLSNKTATQAEFLHTLDAIALGGATLVLASDEHPRSIGRFSRSLVSRFLAGMVVCVERPDRETRLTLLRRLADARSMRLSPSAEQFLASRYPGSARDLEGAIARLAAISALEAEDGAGVGGPAGEAGPEIGMLLVDRLVSQESGGAARPPIRFAAILEAVADELAVPREELLSDGRRREAVTARGLAAYLARRFTSMSFPEIARGLGRRNHSAIHAAESRVRGRLEGDATGDAGLRERCDRISHRLLQRD